MYGSIKHYLNTCKMKIFYGLNGLKIAFDSIQNACYNRYQWEVIEDVSSYENYIFRNKKKGD